MIIFARFNFASLITANTRIEIATVPIIKDNINPCNQETQKSPRPDAIHSKIASERSKKPFLPASDRVFYPRRV